MCPQIYYMRRPVRFISTSCPLFLKFPLFRSFVGVKWRDPEPLCRNANVIHSHSSCGPRPLVILYLSLSDSFCCFCIRTLEALKSPLGTYMEPLSSFVLVLEVTVWDIVRLLSMLSHYLQSLRRIFKLYSILHSQCVSYNDLRRWDQTITWVGDLAHPYFKIVVVKMKTKRFLSLDKSLFLVFLEICTGSVWSTWSCTIMLHDRDLLVLHSNVNRF